MSTVNTNPTEISVMLDELELPAAALRWKELSESPAYSDFTPEQLLREVIEPQYIETMNNRYKTNLRIEAAQKLMRSGMNASEAAARSGFSDVHYFSRVFKRMTGKSPTEWRNQNVRNHSSKEN